MEGDFTRDTFDPKKHYLRVLLQQGRVNIDADWNEQIAILLHRIEALTRDLVGPHGGPADNCGFAILEDGSAGPLTHDFRIGSGRYYVDGLMCENDRDDLTYSGQFPDHARHNLRSGPHYLIFLDAWEEYVSAEEDESRREIALGGADTAGRSKVMWHVGAWELTEQWVRALAAEERKPADRSTRFTNDKLDKRWMEIQQHWQGQHRGRLKVRVIDPAAIEDLPPTIVSPLSSYRGAENHLYRVEVHHADIGGESASGGKGAPVATFKWSRENGSVLFPVASIEGSVLTLRNIGADLRSRLAIGDWVELVEPLRAAIKRSGHLYYIANVDPLARQVTLQVDGKGAVPARANGLMMRRWDQKARSAGGRRGPQLIDGAVAIVEGEHDSNWIDLEDGIQIQFQKGEHRYRSGDYWLIPARTADGGIVEWPLDHHRHPVAAPPRGVTHRYAPLGIVNFNTGSVTIDCRSRVAFRMSLEQQPLLQRT